MTRRLFDRPVIFSILDLCPRFGESFIIVGGRSEIEPLPADGKVAVDPRWNMTNVRKMKQLRTIISNSPPQIVLSSSGRLEEMNCE